MTNTWLTLPKRTLVLLKELDWKTDPFLKLIGTFGGGPSDLSVKHDHYLYGAAKKKPRR